MNQTYTFHQPVSAHQILEKAAEILEQQYLRGDALTSIDSASVYPREVVKTALKANASAAIFAHNHPSGVTTPSEADKRITKRLQDALALTDIRG